MCADPGEVGPCMLNDTVSPVVFQYSLKSRGFVLERDHGRVVVDGEK